MTQGRCAIGKRVALLFSILLFSATVPQETEGFLEAVATGLEVIVHTIESIQQTWEIVEATDVLKHGDGKANPNIKDLVSRKQHELMGRLVEIYRGIENIEHDVSEWSGVVIAVPEQIRPRKSNRLGIVNFSHTIIEFSR